MPASRRTRLVRTLRIFPGLAGLLGALWCAVCGLKTYDINAEALQARYAVPAEARLEVELRALRGVHAQELSLRSFDGSEAQDRIV